MTDGRCNRGLCNYGCQEEDRHGLIVHWLFRYEIQEQSNKGSRGQVENNLELINLQTVTWEIHCWKIVQMLKCAWVTQKTGWVHETETCKGLQNTKKPRLAKEDPKLKLVGVWEMVYAGMMVYASSVTVLLSRNMLFATVKHKLLNLKDFRWRQKGCDCIEGSWKTSINFDRGYFFHFRKSIFIFQVLIHHILCIHCVTSHK